MWLPYLGQVSYIGNTPFIMGMDSMGQGNNVSSLCAGVWKSSVFLGREFS